MLQIKVHYIVVSSVFAGVLLVLIKNAPSGKEDDQGFHSTL
jgi:hypothetical protein